MLGHSHVIIGAAAGVVTARILHADDLAGALVAGVAALVPDIDTPESTFGRHLPHWWHALTPGHRGLTHSLAFCAALGALAREAQTLVIGRPPASWLLTAAVVVGALSHLAADAVTDHGVPLFWPVWRDHVGLPWPLKFRTGSWREHLTTSAVVAGTLDWAYDLHRVVGPLLAGHR
jgi:inner membrane protein